MVSALHEPIFLALFVAELVSFVILTHQGAINYLLYRGSGHGELRTYAIWCSWSALMAACLISLFARLPQQGYSIALHGVTIAAIFAMRYYMASIRGYLGTSSRWLDRLITLHPFVALFPIASLIIVLLGGDGFFLQMRDAPTGNLLLQRLAELIPRNEMLPAFSIVMLALIGIDMGVLISAALKAPRRDAWVMFGILVTCVAVGYEIAAMRAGWRYAVPVIFAANLIEVLRITYVSSLHGGRELASLEHELERQHDMIAAQIRAAQVKHPEGDEAIDLDELAHELRNPLAGAMMFLMTAERRSSDGKPVEHLLPKMRMALEQLADVLATALPGSGPAPEEVTERLVDSIERAETLCSIRVEETAATLEISVAHDLYVNGPPAAVTQVFVNLLSNACDVVAGLSDRTIHVGASRDGNTVVVRVVDPGSRPSALEAEAMFQPRFTMKGNGRGSGLGLRISRRVVQDLGGSLDIDPESPTTCFVVSLPLAASSADLDGTPADATG